MSKERECAEALRDIVGKEPFPTFVAKVMKVDGAKCTVQRLFDDMEIEDVRLNCSTTENEGVVIVPKRDSMVLITSIDGRYWFVSQCSEVEKITIDATDKIVFNGGQNKGLVKIEELTKKLNELVKWCKGHTHSGSFTGTIGGAAAEGALTVPAPPIGPKEFNIEAYEDDKITH